MKLPKLRLKRKANKKAVKRSFKIRSIRVIAFSCLALLVIVVIGVDALAYKYRNDNTSTTKLSNDSATQHASTVIPANTTGKVSTPSISSPSTSTPTTKSATNNQQSIPTNEIQANQQAMCTDFYNNMTYSYLRNVDGLSGTLGNAEDQAYTDGTQEGWTFTTTLNGINNDISSTNSTITSDWNSSFVTNKQAPGCSYTNPNIPTLLQVPSCTAVDFGGISACISQIDTSLNI